MEIKNIQPNIILERIMEAKEILEKGKKEIISEKRNQRINGNNKETKSRNS